MRYFGVVGNRDFIKLRGEKRPFWEFLDEQPAGWLTSLAYHRDDVPRDRPRIKDCGAWSYKAEETPRLGRQEVTPAWALAQYRADAAPGDMVIAPDHMLIPGLGDLNARRRFNRESAAEFIGLDRWDVLRPMAGVHGETIEERLETAAELVRLGYRHLALGGLAGQAGKRAMCVDVVAAVRRAFPGVWLHVLGLSAPAFAVAWAELGVDSFDGASHFKQAFTAGKFYQAGGAELRHYPAARDGQEPTAPLCDCRACALLRADGVDTRRYGSNETNMGRAAHNLNHLMRALRCAMRRPVTLVSCVKGKHGQPLPARDLYASDWFRKARAYAEQRGGRWYILSAEYGLVDPQDVIRPYERTLYGMDAGERTAWAARVGGQLRAVLQPGDRVEILAGERYREHLLPVLRAAGHDVTVPMEGLEIGQQLAWLKQAVAPLKAPVPPQGDLFDALAAA